MGGEIKDVFEELKTLVEPDIIFTHTRHDLHQDHRLVCELTWNTWRDHLILEYEIPKYDGDLGAPNVFVSVAEELAREKTRLILDLFESQTAKHWFDEELFIGLMRIRGMEGRSPSGYAEAFTCRKLCARNYDDLQPSARSAEFGLIDPERLQDERGFFARTWDRDAFSRRVG